MQHEVAVAIAAAVAASAQTRRDFIRPSGIKTKGDKDLVTATDEAVQGLLIEHLAAAFPAHRILGEEGSDADPPWLLDTGFIWLLDPVCGTESFAFGVPLFCTNIALLHDGEPVLAVVAEGLRDEIVWAVRGQGAFLRSSSGADSSLTGLHSDTIIVNYDAGVSAVGATSAFAAAVMHELLRRDRFTVRQLATSATLPMQARGVLAGNIFDFTCPWDSVAGAFICEQAGHRVTGLDGGAWRPYGSRIITGHSEAVHAALLETVHVATAPD